MTVKSKSDSRPPLDPPLPCARTKIESAKAQRLEREVAGFGAVIVDKQIERLFAQHVLLGETVLGHHARNVCGCESDEFNNHGDTVDTQGE